MSNGAILNPPVTGVFRDWPGPTFFQGPNGSRYLYAMRVVWDGLDDAMTYAVLARYPTTCPPDAYQWIGQDRQIDQGFQESTASYTARLVQWLDVWGYAGLPTSELMALLAYVTPDQPEVLTVDNSGNWHVYPAGTTPFPPTQTLPTPPTLSTGTWNWDSLGDPYGYDWQWWRMWIVIYSLSGTPWAAPTLTWEHLTGSVTVTVTSDAVYGSYYQGSGAPNPASTDFNWDGGASAPAGETWPLGLVHVVSDPYCGSCYQGTNGPQATYATPCWDWAGSTQQAQDLVTICNKWRRAGCWIPNIIVSYNNSWFQPTSSAGDLPNGTWGHWGYPASDATYGSYYSASRPVNTICSILDGTPVTLE